MAGVTYKIAERRTEVVEEVVEELQGSFTEVEFVSGVQQLVAEVAEFEDLMCRVTHSFRQGIQPETDPQTIATAHGIAYLLNRVSALFPRIRDLIQVAVRRSGQVNGIERFENAEAAVTRMRKDFESKWPLPDQTRVRVAREQVAAGQYRIL